MSNIKDVTFESFPAQKDTLNHYLVSQPYKDKNTLKHKGYLLCPSIVFSFKQ